MHKLTSIVDYVFAGSYCSFKDKYSLYCPGCGITRALKYLLEFRFLHSLCANPFVILIVLDIVFFIGLGIYERRKFKGTKKLYKLRIKTLTATLAILALFSVLRNVLLTYAGIDFLGDFL